ncbi:hypothetical protein ACVIWU_001317 [Bradyrhizobium sp. USDA 4509]
MRDRVGYSDHVRFRGYFPVHFIPAYNLPVYASQRPLPDATQDSVRGCSLGFAAAVISDGRLQRACKAQPYTIPNVHGDVYCVFTNRTPATAMRGFGVTAMDFAIECQMDKLAHLVGMDPMEFRILNAYRDGDMKAHRREAKNTALIECVQVAAEKAKWPLREDFKRMSSRKDGGGARAAVTPTPREPHAPPASPSQQRTTYDRAPAATREPPPPPPSSPPPSSPPPRPGAPSHGATRFSSVFGTRRR